jgi:hypothetical protein
MLGLGPDEGIAVGVDDLGEAGVFRQEAIAGVNGLGARNLAGGDNLRDVQIGLGRRGRADADAFIGQPHPHGASIGFGMDRDRGNAHFLARPMDAEGDLAAIGDEDFVEHGPAIPE